MKAAPIFCYSYTPMQEVAPNAVSTADTKNPFTIKMY